MDDALGTDALAFAVEAEVEDLLIGVLSADLVTGDAAHQR